ncbi:glutathione S-transfersae-related protein [Vibrio mediterranei AK1]|uniref:MAPEG family protein n=1 Tax=Vibrio TaxID=662 RepID=UPI000153FF17|nr:MULTISPECIES: MAPEG family protein [Vibrio]EDL55303.1 glutathione S-transfersae-related protein [Vibrio mediterranei AK1]MDA0108724.1 MAPEG family protein [Vibrio sp. La 4.2.2]
MITALYGSLLASLMIWLSFQVIKQRRSNQIAYADGGVEALQIARSAQGNAVDYIPITLMLMAFVEYNGAPAIWIHVIGVSFVVGRCLHAHGILNKRFKGRVRGMQITIFAMAGLIVSNLVYLPFDKLW